MNRTEKPMDGRRARKTESKKRLVDAARRLFETGGAEALTMRRLASEAGVSEATPYNVFGGKVGVLVAIFEAFLDSLPVRPIVGSATNELDHVLVVVGRVADLWAEPSGTFCALISTIQRTGELPPELADRPKRELTRAMEGLRETGWLAPEASAEAVAARIAYANAGLFNVWLRGQLSKKQLHIELQLNALLPILAFASDRHKAEILRIVTRLTGEP